MSTIRKILVSTIIASLPLANIQAYASQRDIAAINSTQCMPLWRLFQGWRVNGQSPNFRDFMQVVGITTTADLGTVEFNILVQHLNECQVQIGGNWSDAVALQGAVGWVANILNAAQKCQ